MKNSCLKDLYGEGVVYEEMHGVLIPARYTSVEEEYETYRKKVAFVDGIGYAILKIEGDHVMDEMDALVTKDIQYLNPGKITECFFLNEKAEVLGLSYIVNDDDSIVVIVPPENADVITSWLSEKLSKDCTITDLTEENHLLFMEGEKSWEIVKEVFDFPIETLALREMVKVDYEQDEIMLSRIGRSGEYGYAMIASKEAIHKIAKHVLNTYANQVSWCGFEAMKICMLEVNQPFIRNDNQAEGNIFEMAYQWFIQYDKEAFCGRDVLMEQFEQSQEKGNVGFVAKGVNQIEVGSEVILEDESVGKVIYAQYDPALKGVLGMMFVDSKVAVSGIPLAIKGSNEIVEANTISSPFVRPLSWDSQME